VADIVDFEQILNSCLDRLQAGESVEACLARYPSHADELAPLLTVAAGLRLPDQGPVMSAEGLKAGETRLLARADQLRSQRPARVRRSPRGAWADLLTGTRRLAVASLVVVLLLCGVLSAGTVSAASTSLPGSPLYPVKRATEVVVSAAAFTPELQARVHLAWAERRLREIEVLIERDGMVDEALLADLDTETEQALAAAEESGRVGQLEAAASHTEHQKAVLERVLQKAPPAAKQGLENALEKSQQGHERARSALERAKGQGPPATPPGQDKDKKPPQSESEPDEDQGTSDAPPGNPKGPEKATPPGKGSDKDTPPGKGRDKATPPGKQRPSGQGSDQDAPENTLRGHGQSQGKEQDKVSDRNGNRAPDPANDQDISESSNPGHGYGYGQNKIMDLKVHSGSQGVGLGVIPGLDEKGTRGKSDEKKPSSPPGQDKDKSK
jgi:hypothetical protein